MNLTTNKKNGFYIFGQIVSTILHPVFIPFYLTALILYLPNITSLTTPDKKQMLLIVGINSILFPCLVVLLSKALKFSNSILLEKKQDRIIPYICSGIFYFWGFQVMKNNISADYALTSLFLGLFLCVSIAVIANNFFKISMHGMGWGGAIAFLFLKSYNNSFPYPFVIAVVIIIAGIAGSIRLMLNSHEPKELYWGYFLGAVTQLVAHLIMNSFY